MTDGTTGGADPRNGGGDKPGNRGDSLNPAQILAGWRDAVKVSAFALAGPPLRLAGIRAPSIEEGGLARAARGFPVVGAIAGLAAGLVYAVADGLGLPAIISAIFAIGLLAALGDLSGERGLARSAHALMEADTREGRLALLEPGPLGAYPIVVLVMALGLRVAALAAVGRWGAGAATSLLAAAVAASYGVLPLVLYYVPAARDRGLVHAAGRPRFDQAVLAALLGAAVALLFLGPLVGIVALGVGALGALKFAWLAKWRFGGLTGDLLGAARQGGEIGVLLAVAALR